MEDDEPDNTRRFKVKVDDDVPERKEKDAITAAHLRTLMPSALALENLTKTLDSIGKTFQPPKLDIPVIKSGKDYMLEAQWETRNAIQEMHGALETSVEVQREQHDILKELLYSNDHQTRLTRWVLGVAIATALATVLGIAATVLVAAFVV